MNFKAKVGEFVDLFLDTLYPIRIENVHAEFGDVKLLSNHLMALLRSPVIGFNEAALEIVEEFEENIHSLKVKLNNDIKAIYNGDPAAKNPEEIIICYPGFYAVAAYRIAHLLYKNKVILLPRIITEHAHAYTGIDIHPGATIGSYLCIDHGSGVVIGETTIIGDHVKIYQGVTLGALSIDKKNMVGKRHPTIEDNVVIYAQATILGGDTVIGAGSIIGGNVWLTKSVDPGSKIYYRQ